MTNPEEAKKLVVRPRKIEPKTDGIADRAKSVSEPRAAEPASFDAESGQARKRPSPALRPAASVPLKEEVKDAPLERPDSSPAADDASEHEPLRGSRKRRSKGLSAPVPMGVALVVAIVFTVVSGFFFYSAGTRAGFQEAESTAMKEQVDLPEDFLARFDDALDALQNGNATAALEQFEALEKEQPDVATMSLLIANAALLGNDSDTAQLRITESIRRRESISDALTLQAILEAKLATDSDYKKMGSPRVRIEQLLRQAIAADSANARPHFELATLKRFEGKLEEAEALLVSARYRIHAADSRTVTDTALALTRQQRLEDSGLSIPENPAPTPEALFAAAYAAMRLGETERAKGFLDAARGFFPENVVRQILKDPAFIPYFKDPAYEAYFPKTEQPRKP